MNILIADDEPICRRVLQSLLVKWDFHVHPVADGTAALEALSASDAPRLAILDWEMPGLTGPEVCRRLRARPDGPQPHLVLLTAREGKEHVTEAIHAGANDYLSKPVDANELRVRLDIALGLLEKSDLELASRELGRRVDQGLAELASLHANNERLLAAIPCLLIGLDARGVITRWNRTAEETFGLPARAAVGRAIADLPLRWEDATVPAQILRCGRASATVRVEGTAVVAPGRRRVLDLAIAPVLCPGQDAPTGVLVLADDRTEQQLLKAQLAQAQKLESIGQLAAGMAHEINTPIQYIGDNTTFIGDSFRDVGGVLALYRRAGTDAEGLRAAEAAAVRAEVDYLLSESRRAIDQTLEGVRHVAEIVKAMKEFARPGSSEKAPVDLNQALLTVVAVARNEWKYVADVVTRFDPRLPPVLALPGELNQVFLNLLVNAAHAVQAAAPAGGPKGVITITTRARGDAVEILVADTGTGIPEAVRDRVFDPFFTTKPVGQGTGQGLAISHAVVVNRHGGAITFETHFGKGTTFCIRLPIDGRRLTDADRVNSDNTARPCHEE